MDLFACLAPVGVCTPCVFNRRCYYQEFHQEPDSCKHSNCGLTSFGLSELLLPVCRVPNIVYVLEAITPKVCQETYSYERFELLGDAFLKYAVSLFLFHKFPEAHEGTLLSHLAAGSVMWCFPPQRIVNIKGTISNAPPGLQCRLVAHLALTSDVSEGEQGNGGDLCTAV